MISCRKIYVLCPANVKSGGPELLHQLVYQLNQINSRPRAYIVYYNLKTNNPVVPAYKKYVGKNWIVEQKIEDNGDNLLIIPETGLSQFNICKDIQKAIWWLSVDNFLNTNYFNSLIAQVGLVHGIIAKLKGNIKNRAKLIYKADYHFYQSYYAKDYLIKKGISFDKMFYLSDYINDYYVDSSKIALNNKRKNIVLYNPKKGIEFTSKIIKATPNYIKFVPLINMTNEQIFYNLVSSKVYIDFGNHPGKDRFPREAAILGCCVITGRRGSANYSKDVPIEEKYKILDKDENIPLIVKRIQDCVDNYNLRQTDFYNYRKKITKEKAKFIESCKEIFDLKE